MSYETRFNKRAAADPQGFDQAVKQRFGFPAADVDKLLRMASKLAQPWGGQLSGADIKTLQALHPHVSPRDIADMADRLNTSEPDRRFELFAGLLADDAAGMYGDYVNANDRFKEIADLTREYTTAEYAEAVNARRGGSADAPPSYKEPEGSVRDLVERQMVPKGMRELNDAFERGDPQAESAIRQHVADRIDNAADRLEKPGDSTRDTVEAAFDLHQGEAIAQSEFGIGETSP